MSNRTRTYWDDQIGAEVTETIYDVDDDFDDSDEDRRAEPAKDDPAKMEVLAPRRPGKVKSKLGEVTRLEDYDTWPALTNQGPDRRSMTNVLWFCLQTGIQAKRNDFDQRTYVLIDGKQCELDDDALRETASRMHLCGCVIALGTVHDALQQMGTRNRFHPVRDYLDGLTWDRKKRLDRLLPHYLNAEDTPLNRAIGRAWMVAGVRRVRQPGCKFDAIMTLVSEQGTGKSKFFNILAGDQWFNDCIEIGASAKEMIENTAGSWILEYAELSNLNNREVEAVKKSVSTKRDRARVAFARLASAVDRQFVCGATVNRVEFLKDDTGNRRFWIVQVGKTREAELVADRDQLWAEAAYLEAKGEPINIPEKLWPAAAEVAERHMKEDALADAAATQLGQLPSCDAFVTAADLAAAVGIADVARRGGANAQSIAAGARRMGWNSDNRRLSGWDLKGRPRYYVAPLSKPNAVPVWYRWNSDKGKWEKKKAEPL